MDYSYLQSAVAAGLVVDINTDGGNRHGSSLQVLTQKHEANQRWIKRTCPGRTTSGL
jgi:hypothetical protein